MIRFTPYINNVFRTVNKELLIKLIISDIVPDEFYNGEYVFQYNQFHIWLVGDDKEYLKKQGHDVIITDDFAAVLVGNGACSIPIGIRNYHEHISKTTNNKYATARYKLIELAYKNRVEYIVGNVFASEYLTSDFRDYILETNNIPYSYTHDCIDFLLEVIKRKDINKYNKLLPSHELYKQLEAQVHSPHQLISRISPSNHYGSAYYYYINNVFIQFTYNYIDVHIFLVIEYPIKWKVDEYDIITANNMINIERLLSNHPDVLDSPLRFSWWLDCVIELCLYHLLNDINESFLWGDYELYESHVIKLVELIGFISLWSVLSESGTGSNSWLLNHPLTQERFIKFVKALLEDNKYTEAVEALGFGTMNISIDNISDLDELDKLINTIFTNTDFTTFKSLSTSITWAKNMRNYNIQSYYDITVDLIEEPIFSPSGLCIIPWVIN